MTPGPPTEFLFLLQSSALKHGAQGRGLRFAGLRVVPVSPVPDPEKAGQRVA